MADASRFLAKADEALKKRNYDYAVQMYQEALLVDPGNADARRNLRVALVRKYDEKGYPKSFGLGGLKSLSVGKNPEKILEDSEKAIVKDPKNLKINRRIAEVLGELKHNDAAVAVLEYAYKYCGGDKDVTTLKLMARAYIEVNETKRAEQILNKAMRVSPNDKEVKTLAKEIAAKGYHDKFSSVKSSRDLTKNRGEQDQLEKRRKIVMSEEDIESLLAEEEEKLKENPLDRRAIREIGALLAKKKKFNDAYERLRKFLEVDPNASEVGDIAAEYKNKHFDHYIRICQIKAQKEPDKAAAYKAKEDEFRAEKRAFQLEEFGRQVEAAPTDLDKRYRYGVALFNADRAEEAFKHFQKAHRSPKFAKAVAVYMGRCLTEMGRIEMAEQQFHNVEAELTEADEDLRKELMYYQAEMMEKKGDLEAALAGFRTLFLEDADFLDVEKRIDDLNGKIGRRDAG